MTRTRHPAYQKTSEASDPHSVASAPGRGEGDRVTAMGSDRHAWRPRTNRACAARGSVGSDEGVRATNPRIGSSVEPLCQPMQPRLGLFPEPDPGRVLSCIR